MARYKKPGGKSFEECSHRERQEKFEQIMAKARDARDLRQRLALFLPSSAMAFVRIKWRGGTRKVMLVYKDAIYSCAK